LRASISSHIAIAQDAIPPALREEICAALTIRNPDKDRALSEHIRGAADLPDELWLWSERGGRLILPRGFAHRLQTIALHHHEQVEWKSGMRLYPPSQRCFADWPQIELRDYQAQARNEMLDWASGICMAPTGVGKTRIALEVARWAGQPTLVIVDKISLAKQWMTVIADSYGYEAGFIGDGVWKEQHFTVALRQSLWARRENTPAGFWTYWGMLILDEVHHASAETLTDLIQRFTAFYRLGYSATPVMNEDLFSTIEAIVGPIVHRTLAADVAEVLVKPSVVVVPTAFEFDFVPTHMRGHQRVQNNYTAVMAALCADDRRNNLIVDIALEEADAGHHVLITTRRVEHVERIIEKIALRVAVQDIAPFLYVLTGKQSKIYEETRRAIASATTGTILVSTIADEALDIPRLDRLIMAYPARRVPLVEQQIGRIGRPAGGKTDAIVFDIYDEKIGVMKGQHRDRSQQLYLRRRWAIERRESVVA
jgi:superfamily II DNA or RNA helicase